MGRLCSSVRGSQVAKSSSSCQFGPHVDLSGVTIIAIESDCIQLGVRQEQTLYASY